MNDHATRIAAAAAEIADRYSDIEGEAMQAAQVEQNIEAGEHVLRTAFADILRRHFPPPPDWCDRPTVVGDWECESEFRRFAIRIPDQELLESHIAGLPKHWRFYGPIPPRPEEKHDVQG